MNMDSSNVNQDNQRFLRRRRKNRTTPDDDSELLGFHLEQQKNEQDINDPEHEASWENENRRCKTRDRSDPIVSDSLLQNNLSLSPTPTHLCYGEEIFRFPHYYYDDDCSNKYNHHDNQYNGKWNSEQTGQGRQQKQIRLPRGELLLRCCDSPQHEEFYFLSDKNASVSKTNPRELAEFTDNHCAFHSEHPFAFTCLIFTSSVAVVLSLTIIIAVTLPLFDKTKRSRVSAYNLYLVILAIPDCVYTIFQICSFSNFTTGDQCGGDEIPLSAHPWNFPFFAFIATIFLYTNAIISYEILKLLTDSKCRRRARVPTIKRACVQAAGTYTLGCLVFLVNHFGMPIVTLLSISVITLMPSLFIIWVCFQIWQKELLSPHAKTGKRLQILVRYYFRIIVVYFIFWLPASILCTCHFFQGNYDSGLLYYLGILCYGIQVWVSFGFSLTKPDVLEDVLSLFACLACRELAVQGITATDDKISAPGNKFKHGITTQSTSGLSGEGSKNQNEAPVEGQNIDNHQDNEISEYDDDYDDGYDLFLRDCVEGTSNFTSSFIGNEGRCSSSSMSDVLNTIKFLSFRISFSKRSVGEAKKRLSNPEECGIEILAAEERTKMTTTEPLTNNNANPSLSTPETSMKHNRKSVRYKDDDGNNLCQYDDDDVVKTMSSDGGTAPCDSLIPQTKDKCVQVLRQSIHNLDLRPTINVPTTEAEKAEVYRSIDSQRERLSKIEKLDENDPMFVSRERTQNVNNASYNAFMTSSPDIVCDDSEEDQSLKHGNGDN